MWDQNQYINGWNFATDAHLNQLLPGSEYPYINHVGLVATEVLAAICHAQTPISSPIKQPTLAMLCALLHDTIEDTPITYNDIVTQFGKAVADGVMALTKDINLATKQEQMRDSLHRIKQQPAEVSMVKLADRITNLQSPPHYWTKEKIHQYRIEAQLILDELGGANEFLANRLNDKIISYQQYC